MLADGVDDGLLALAVRGGDPVVARLEVGVFLPEGFPVVKEDGGAAARGVLSNFEIVHVGWIV